MKLLWLLLFITIVHAAPPYFERYRRSSGASDSPCAQLCSGISSEVKYEIGKAYTYDISSKSVLNLGEGKQETNVLQRARAIISVHTKCEFSLKLSDVSLTGLNIGSDWRQILESYPLRFGFDDGKIVSVCPSDGDPVWAVNVKRSILSTFQFMHESDWEDDVVGSCPVERERSRRGSGLSVKTIKNVASCYRKHDISGIRSVSYRIPSKIQGNPVFEAKQTCDREVQNGVLRKASCVESHKADSPFGKSSAVSAVVEQQMTLSGGPTIAGQMQPFKKRSCIIYDHSEDQSVGKTNVNSAKANIDLLCRSGPVVAESASTFIDLVFNLRGLSSSEINSIARKDCSAFTDALAVCGSADCVAQLGQLISSGSAPDNIYLSLALIHNPKIAVIDNIASFIDRVPVNGLLGISSLVQAYCHSNSKCGSEQSVKKIVDSLISKITRGCNIGQDFKEIKKVITILKSIGNIGNEENSLSLLNECLSNKRNPIEIQLAAIDALRRKPCSDLRNYKIEKLFFDNSEDEEIRIASFKQLIQCANDSLIQRIANRLSDSEISNQVGSYVWSYINTKRRSSNPTVRDLQTLFKRKHISQRFNLDPRKFSRYYETGYFDPENNYGGHLDTSVIFSPKGYLPRDLSYNFTVHLFGKSFNFLEFGIRGKGLEHAEEDFFGADGYYTNPNGHVFHEKEFRSRNDKINQLKSLYERGRDTVPGRVSLTYYTRMFGDDLSFCGFEKDNFVDEVKEYMDMGKALSRFAQGHEIKVSKNALLASVIVTVPTLSGLPLQFGHNASLSVHVEQKAKADLVDLIKGKTNAHIVLERSPSASLFVSAALTIRAGHVASGMQLVSKLHTSTNFGIDVELKEGKMFSAKVIVPDQKSTIALLQTEVSKIDNNKITSVGSPSSGERQICSGQNFAKLLGLKACVTTDNRFPTLQAAVTLEKVDRGLKFYQFLVDRQSSADGEKLRMSVDTPGSEVNRKIEANFDLSLARKKLKFDLITPVKKISLDGDLEEKKKLEDYAAKLKLSIDDKSQYSLQGDLKATKLPNRKKFNLNAKAVAGSSSAADVSAEVEYNTDNKPYARIDFNLDKVFDKPIIFKTLLNVATPQYESKLEYSGPSFNGRIEGSLTHSGLLDAKGFIKGDYQVGNQPKRTINIAAENVFKRTAKDHLLKHIGTFDISALPKYEIQIISDRQGDSMKNLLEVTRGSGKSTLTADINRNPNGVFTGLIKANSDTFGLNHKADVTYQNKFPQQFLLKVNAETPTIKGLLAHVEYAMKVDPKWNLNGQAHLTYPGREIIITKRIDETEPGKYKMETHVQWDPNSKIDVSSDVVYRKNKEYTVQSVAKVSGMPEPFHIRKHVKYEPTSQNLHWQVRQGSTIVYEVLVDSEGQIGSKRKFNVELKSEKFNPRFNYQLLGDYELAADKFNANGMVKKDGREVGKGSLTAPKSLTAPSKKFYGEFSWNYDNKQHSALGEFICNKNPRGSSHSLRIESDKESKLSAQLDIADTVLFKSNIDWANKKLSVSEIKIGSLKLDNFNVEGLIETYPPLPQRSIKGKSAFAYKQDQVMVEGLVESGGERYLLEGRWKKERSTGLFREYTYQAKIYSPNDGINFEQQLRVEGAFSLRKAQTGIEVKSSRKTAKLSNDLDIAPGIFKTNTEITGEGILLKHNIDYTHVGGRRTVKKSFKFNDKEINTDLETVYQDRELKINIDAKTTFPAAKVISSKLGCTKDGEYWSCSTEGNINNKYVVKGHEHLSTRKIDVGYALQLGNIANNEANLLLELDNIASKYAAKALLRNENDKYNFEVDIDREKGSVLLQTPTQQISDARIRVLRKGRDEFEATSETRQGKIVFGLKTASQENFFRLQITENQEPFELVLKNAKEGAKQTSLAQLTLDPLKAKKVYGVENALESEGDKFRGLKTVLKHPKRSVSVEVLRPSQNTYRLVVQPNVGSNRRPTVAEMIYDKTANGYDWQGSLSDEALSSPIKMKIQISKTGNDESNYAVNIVNEFDYSGSPDKLFSRSLKLERRQDGPNVKFDLEIKASHPASNFHTLLGASVLRKPIDGVLVPVNTNLKAELKNARGNLVAYTLDAETDGKTFSEFRVEKPGSSLKARIDQIGPGHLRLGFFKDSQKPSMVGEVRADDKGFMCEIRDDKSGDVKIHASATKINEYAAEAELWHSTQGNKIRDAKLSVKVGDNNLVKANVYVRPELETEVTDTAKTALGTAKNLEQTDFMKEAIAPSIAAQKNILKDVTDTFSKLFKSWSDEQRKFANELGPEYAQLVDKLEDKWELAKEGILLIYDQTYQTVEQIGSSQQSQLIDSLRQLKSGTGDIAKQITQSFKPVSDFFSCASKKIDKLREQIIFAVKYLDENLKIKELRAALKDFQDKSAQVDIIKEILKGAKKLSKDYELPEVQKAIEGVESERKVYEAKAAELYQKAKDIILDSMTVSALTKLTNAILDPVVPDPVDDVEMRKKWENIVAFLRGKISSEQFAQNLYKKYIPDVKRKGRGEFEAEITVPYGVSSLNELIEDFNPDRLIALKDAFADTARSVVLTPAQREVGYALFNAIHTYQPKGPDFTPVTELESIAYLIGPDRMITFDGRVFAFRANCEYLLAADLINQQFALTALFVPKAGKPALDAVKCEIRGQEIIIYKNGKVEVDRAPVSLPWQKVDSLDGTSLTSVKKEGDWVTLKTYDGLRVQCNSAHDICEIALPGRMHGRSKGLLGLNDYEPANDFDFVDGTDNDKVNALAEHYSVKGSCRTNEAEVLQKRESPECQKLFQDSSSPLRLCFSQVLPTSFELICSGGGPGDKCNAASAYVQACVNAGVEVSLPSGCEGCTDDLKVDEQKRIEKPSNIDIVFVVEERTCMNSFKDKIARVASQIARQQRDVRFGWIGFGGEGNNYDPHIHYEGNSASLDSQVISKLTQASFEPSSGIEGNPLPPTDAVLFAVNKYPFRVGTSKNIVLVQCRKCDGDKSELLDTLLEQGVTFHVLSLAKIKTSDGTKAVGLSADQLFGESGSPVGHRSVLLSAADACSIAAQESGGFVFNLKTGGAAAAAKIQPKSRCMICSCVVESLVSRSVCRPCEPIEPVPLGSLPSARAVDDSDLFVEAFL